MNEAADDEAIWQRSPRVVERTFTGTTVLLNRDTGESLVLRQSGALVWAALAFSGSLEELADAVADISGDVSTQDVTSVLERLRSTGFATSSS